jgi:hypothetical protein
MPAPPISRLPKGERKQFLADLNYLNTSEIKAFCKRHALPYTIAIETVDGRRQSTQEDDRKGVMLDRVRYFLRTGMVLRETCFRPSVVSFDRLPPDPSPDDKLCYGQYKKTSLDLIALLKGLTHGHFRDGAVARILLRDFWTRGKAPTIREFAAAWQQASQEHTEPNPEWAFLSDRARKTAGADWKKMRARRAAAMIKTLAKIASPGRNLRKSRASE